MALGKYKLSLSLVTRTAQYSYHITFQGSSGFIVPPHSQLNLSDLICRVSSCARSFRHRDSRQRHERSNHQFRKSNNFTFELNCYNIIMIKTGCLGKMGSSFKYLVPSWKYYVLQGPSK